MEPWRASNQLQVMQDNWTREKPMDSPPTNDDVADGHRTRRVRKKTARSLGGLKYEVSSDGNGFSDDDAMMTMMMMMMMMMMQWWRWWWWWWWWWSVKLQRKSDKTHMTWLSCHPEEPTTPRRFLHPNLGSWPKTQRSRRVTNWNIPVIWFRSMSLLPGDLDVFCETLPDEMLRVFKISRGWGDIMSKYT